MIKEQLESIFRDVLDQELNAEEGYKQKVCHHKKNRQCAELRKARSRVAAKGRREKENLLFRELATLLPLAPNLEAQLDKASIIRLTIAYLRLRGLLDPVHLTVSDRDTPSGSSCDEVLLDSALGGFLLLVSLNGQVIFTTKEVITHTGINQMDLIGQRFFDFVHPCDHTEIKSILSRFTGSQGQQECEVFLRIKNANNQKLTPFKVIHCTGVLKSSPTPGSSCLVLLCRPLPVQEVIEMDTDLNAKTYLSIHSPDMRFTYCHSGVLELTGFTDRELFGQSVYQYCHTADCLHIFKSHLSMFSKGQASTGRYRLLLKHGGYVWAETDASVVFNSFTGKPEKVVCINYILSGVEQSGMLFSLDQTECLLKTHDSLSPETQSLSAPTSAAALQTDTNQSTTYRAHHQNSQFTSPLQVRINESPEDITEGPLECTLSDCDRHETDLDALAPYIPMHGEDFLLSASVEQSELGTCWPCLNSPAELKTYLGSVPTFTNCHLHTQHLVNSLHSTHRHSVESGTELMRPWSDTLSTKSQAEYDSQNGPVQPMTHQLGRVIPKVSKDLSRTQQGNCDGSVYSCPWSLPGPVSQSTKPRDSQRYTPTTTRECTKQEFLGKSPHVLLTLPVLSGWECEVNAPLGSTSYLLNGTEITSVLDQAASRVPW
ncbi:hypoxia inducible factor 1 subunit alpha, like 2 [Chanos chanos]|uniref:Hypoxia-inducible factor 1-alpha n=1 Tax=Chanos chanos TaxID=29144 RepID=A0A6J2W487_CHACN|nr:hypoxia-inducible factor 1-alpha-like [Chanos chanos]